MTRGSRLGDALMKGNRAKTAFPLHWGHWHILGGWVSSQLAELPPLRCST